MPEAVFWGRIALTIGLAGLGASFLLALANVRDRISLRRGSDTPSQYRPPKWGLLDRSLGEFFGDPAHTAPLSPDAAAEYIIGRLEATRDMTQSAIRYFSYAPLLCGLMGTIFALRALLVVQGNTLQQIQPHLAGVFAGTLAGILGSLLAAVGGLVLDWTSLSTVNRAQDFIHRHILPTLPERRIAVRIEDAVLVLIAEKAQAVADSFRNSMQPVATQMEDIAERCGKSAEAVREAGDLELASRNFKSGAHMIDSSAEQLSDATKQTAEVILRVGEIRQSLTDLLGRIQETSENLSGASTRLGVELASRMMELHAQGEKLQASAVVLHPAIQSLSAELVRRAGADSAHLELIRGHVETSSRTFTTVTEILKGSSDDLKTVPTRIEAIGGSIADGMRQGVATGMNLVADNIAKRLDNLVAILERSIGALSKAISETKPRVDGDSPIGSPELVTSIHEVVVELRKTSGESRRLADALQQVQSSHSDNSAKKGDGFFRRFFGDR
jgi:methyl-accepting chemotaxis protein